MDRLKISNRLDRVTSRRVTRPAPIDRRAAGAMAMVALCGLLPLGAAIQDQAPADVDSTRAALEQWVNTRRIISQEQRDWALGREMLNDRIELVQREIESLREKISEAEESITEADRKRADLVEENEKLKEASSVLDEIAASMERRITEMLPQLPDPITARIKPLSQRIPEPDSDVSISLSQRFQNLVGILNEINKFNREIALTSEVRTLPDGTSAEVTAMYLGIGQAYYVGANGSIAGVGTATADGWVWTPANDAAPAVAKAIAILRNEEVASFVKLPITIK